MPTAPTITGAIGTGALLSDNRKIDMSDDGRRASARRDAVRRPRQAPPQGVAVNPEFSHLEHDQEPRFDQINNGGGYNSAATSWVVDHGSYFAQHDIVFVPRTERDRPRAGRLREHPHRRPRRRQHRRRRQQRRGAADHGLRAARRRHVQAGACQPAREGHQLHADLHGAVGADGDRPQHADNTSPHEWARQAAQKGVEHLKEIEYALLFGHPSEDLTGSQPRRTTGGARHFITTNVTDGRHDDGGGVLGGAAADLPVRQPREGVAVGALPISVINQYAQNKVQVITPTQNRTA
jgi:hypothetical protein